MTQVRPGDVFRFHGLDGKWDQERVMHIHSTSVNGDVAYRIVMVQEGTGNTLTSVPYDRLLLLIRDGIWVKDEGA